MRKAKWSLSREIKDRLLRKRLNALVLILGPTGSGKSWSALRLAEKIDPNFNVEQVIFEPLKFIQILNKPKRLKSGSCLIFDDAGLIMDSRSFMSFTNRAVSHLLQSFRYRRICTLFTSPSDRYIDIGARRLFHYQLEVTSTHKPQGFIRFKVFRIIHKSKFSEPFTIYPRGPNYKITRIPIGRPSGKLIQAYEQKKRRFLQMYGKKLEAELQPKEEERKLSDSDIIKMVKKKLKGKQVTISRVQAIAGTSEHKARQIRDKMVLGLT